MIALALVLCLWCANAAAQVTIQPKDEIFIGYSWLHIGGYADFGIKVNDIPHGFDASYTYYLPKVHNLGIVVDGSGHFNTGFPNYTGVGFAMAGLQYKYHTDSFSPFARFMVGTANLSPAYPPTPPGGDNEWRFAFDAGGGFDYALGHRFSLRVVQADYIYTTYKVYCSGVVDGVCVPANRTSTWNNVRLATGVIFNLGNYYTAPAAAACTATPSQVNEGEPVTVTATGSNFNPKHTLTYAWTTNGGKIDTASAQSAHIDTTGVVQRGGGTQNFTANATVSDPKMKKGGSATCSANFSVVGKPAYQPPQVSCSVNPSSVTAGTPATITISATSPDNAQISNYTATASAGSISGSGTTWNLDTVTITDPNGATVNINVSATDEHNLAGNGSCTLSVQPNIKPQCEAPKSIAFPDKHRPWRVDNEAKQILDDTATRLKGDPNAKIVIIGYADGEKAPMEGTGKKRHPMNLAAQRAVNAKAYLVEQDGIDPGRIEVRTGTGKSQTADIVWVPQGADEASATSCPQLQNTTPVDESVVKPNQKVWPKGLNAAPAPKPHHHHAAKKTPPTGQSNPPAQQ